MFDECERGVINKYYIYRGNIFMNDHNISYARYE